MSDVSKLVNLIPKLSPNHLSEYLNNIILTRLGIIETEEEKNTVLISAAKEEYIKRQKSAMMEYFAEMARLKRLIKN